MAGAMHLKYSNINCCSVISAHFGTKVTDSLHKISFSNEASHMSIIITIIND